MNQVIANLQQSANEELKAAHDYRIRAKAARTLGDEQSAKLLEHIAMEEDVHYKEFMERIAQLENCSIKCVRKKKVKIKSHKGHVSSKSLSSIKKVKIKSHKGHVSSKSLSSMR